MKKVIDSMFALIGAVSFFLAHMAHADELYELKA